MQNDQAIVEGQTVFADLDSRTGARGFSAIEATLVVSILALCALTIGSSMLDTIAITDQTEEYAAAMRAAREKLEEISVLPLTGPGGMMDLYGPGRPGATFEVIVRRDLYSGTDILLPGLIVVSGEPPEPAGEVIIIANENSTSADYGRDLSSPVGPDGVSFGALPMDLNCDGDTSDDLATSVNGVLTLDNSIVRVPVGVVIRWNSNRREERVELWKIVSRY